MQRAPVLLLFVVLAVALAGCDAGRVTRSPAPTAKPPQWPVPGHDPQRTGTASGRGPIDPGVVKGFPRRGKGQGSGDPVIAGDGTLYAAIGDGIYAVLPDGSERGRGWPVAMAPGDAPRLAIGSNGAVFVARGSFLTSLQPDGGTIREGWPVTKTGVIVSVMDVTADTVYVAWVDKAAATVEAYSYSGKLRPGWPVTLPQETLRAMAVAPDGTVYLAGDVIRAYTPDGKARPGWPATMPGVGAVTSLTLGPDGTVYAATLAAKDSDDVYALAPDGTVRAGWPYRAAGSASSTLLALGPDGTLYNAVGDALYALGTSGVPSLRWKTDDAVRSVDALAIGSDGTVYYAGGASSGVPGVWARGADGKELAGWPLAFALPGVRLIGMAIGTNGVLFITAADGNVLAYIDASATPSVSPSSPEASGSGASPAP